MGRPSVAPERRAQIIAAATGCIAEYGLAGTTLELIAERSGLSRPHIRHYLGNRDQIIDAVWHATIAPYLEASRDADLRLADATPDEALDAALGLFFGERMQNTGDLPVFRAFLDHRLADDRLRATVEAAYGELWAHLLHAVAVAAPGADPGEAQACAFAVYAIAVGASMSGRVRTFDPYRATARASARSLVQALRERGQGFAGDHR